MLAGPIADALEPLPDMSALWLAMARRVGLIAADATGERAIAAPPEFWSEHAVHLPQMIATGWLGLRQWHELGGMRHEAIPPGAGFELALPYLRPAVLLWLAATGEDEWVPLDDLGAHLTALAPRWDRPVLSLGGAEPELAANLVARPGRGRAARHGKPGGSGGGDVGRSRVGSSPLNGLGSGVLDAVLLGRGLSAWAWSAPPRSREVVAGWSSSPRRDAMSWHWGLLRRPGPASSNSSSSSPTSRSSPTGKG